MAEREVKVSLVAQVNNFIADMDRAAKKTREVGAEAEKLAQKSQAFETLGRSAIAFGIVAAGAIALAVTRFADFDQAMSQVQAATQETTGNMQLLREAALEAGGRTVFTATEAANAIEELGKNGLNTAQILGGGLNAALDLAAAGGIAVARAAEIAAITAKQFNLEGREIPKVADLLSAGAGKAAGGVEDMAQALNQAALVASKTGLSVEETTGTLTAFADAGLLGSDAGTSLRTMLLRLTPVSGEAAKEMERIGLSAFDSSGEFVGMAQFAGQLQSKLGNLSTEQRNLTLTTIFGQDAIRGATLLYEQGAVGIQKYIDQTNDSGYAAKVAADRLNNLAGDLEKLGGAFDTALIKSGSGANETLRGLVQASTFLVDAIGGLPKPVTDAGLAVGTVATAVALVGGTALVAVPKISDFRNALAAMNISGRSAAVGIGLVGGAVAVATVILSAFLMEQAASAGRVDEFANSLDAATGSVTNYTRELVVKKLQEKGAFGDAKRFGISQQELTDAVLEGGDALQIVNDKMAAYSEGAKGNQFRAEGLRSVYSTTATVLRTTREELDAARGAYENSTAATEDNSAALADLRGEAVDAGDAVNNLASIIRGFAEATLSTRNAERDFQAAIDAATESVVANGVSLDINSEQGRDNEASLDSIAQAAISLSAARLEETGSQELSTAAIQAGRDALIEQLTQYGITGAEAQAYADKLGLIPENVNTAVTVDTSGANRAINDLKSSLAAFQNSGYGVNISGYIKSLERADGGILPGPPSRVDNMLIRAASGEFVVNAMATANPANRAMLEHINSGGSIRGYANGGFVQPQYASDRPRSGGMTVSMPSLDGLAITGRLEIGGDGLGRIIDGRIEQRGRFEDGVRDQGSRGF